MSTAGKAYILRGPNRTSLELNVPHVLLDAQEQLSGREKLKILRSTSSVVEYLHVLLSKKRKALDTREEHIEDSERKWVEAHLYTRGFTATPEPTESLENMMKVLRSKHSDPALKHRALHVAKTSSDLFFRLDSHPLLLAAFRRALLDKDERFFISLGTAFARARKAANTKPRARLLSQNSWPGVLAFMGEWWIDRQAGAPWLCMFTDQAIGELLALLFNEEKDWHEVVRKTRQRHGLKQASRKVIRMVRLRASKSGKLLKADLLIQRPRIDY